MDPIHQLSIFLVVACQVILGQSHHGCSFMFSMLQYLIQLCLMRDTEKISQCDRHLLSNFLADPCPAEIALLLDRQSTILLFAPMIPVSKATSLPSTLDYPFPYIQNSVRVFTLANAARKNYFAQNTSRAMLYSCPSKPSYILIQKTGWVVYYLSLV
jgi:hypothetical protein